MKYIDDQTQLINTVIDRYTKVFHIKAGSRQKAIRKAWRRL